MLYPAIYYSYLITFTFRASHSVFLSYFGFNRITENVENIMLFCLYIHLHCRYAFNMALHFVGSHILMIILCLSTGHTITLKYRNFVSIYLYLLSIFRYHLLSGYASSVLSSLIVEYIESTIRKL